LPAGSVAVATTVQFGPTGVVGVRLHDPLQSAPVDTRVVPDGRNGCPVGPPAASMVNVMFE
jgi:hypothetical protein